MKEHVQTGSSLVTAMRWTALQLVCTVVLSGYTLASDDTPKVASSGTINLRVTGAGLNAEDITVTGRVTDENGSGLPGVNILVKGTQRGVITGSEGTYTISAPNNGTLIFSYIGYVTQEVLVSNRSQINVTLDADNKTLNEVVVVGYGEQKKSNITGSISSLKGAEIARVQSPSFDNALQGKVPGVYVTSNGGQPGGGISVRIRGVGAINNSNPLYIIDGVQRDPGSNENANALANINPNDIESIDILKDAASTAIYGARAANGVVLITTKRGTTGKPQVSYSTYYGLQNPSRKMPRPMNAMEFAQNMNAAFTAAGQNAPFPDPQSLGEGTDWLSAGTKQGTITDHQISLAGGSARNKYYISANYFRNNGMMLKTHFERMSIRINTDNQINDKIKVGNSFMFSRIDRRDNGAGNRGFIHGAFTDLYQALPTMPVYNEDGTFAGPTDARLERRENFIAQVLRPKVLNESYDVIGNLYAEYEPIKNLRFRTSFSTNFMFGNDYRFDPIWSYGLINSGGLTNLSVGNSISRQWIWENTLFYNKSFGKHNIGALVGTTALDLSYRGNFQSGRYDTDAFTEINSQSMKSINTSTGSSEESLASVFGRLTYDFNDKYLLTMNIRRDGSSKFGPNKKFGVFPSISAGWRISEEAFFPKTTFLDNLKIRAGYGQVGSDAIGNFRYLARVQSGYNYAFGNQSAITSLGAALGDLGNPDIKWETVSEYNTGIEASFLNGAISFSAEYFNRTRTDMLLTLDLPGVSGLSTVTENTGEFRNKGFEFSMDYRKGQGEFKYSINANLTTFNNRVISLGARGDIFPFNYSGSGGSTLIRVGQPLGVFYGLVTEGLFQNQDEVDAANGIDGNPETPYQVARTGPGDFKYKDLNGDGRITDADKTIIGDPNPKFTFGLGGNFSYKRFDLNLQFFGVQGNDIFNVARSILESSGRAFNKSSTVVNAWSGPGTSNTIPRPIITDPNSNTRLGSHLIEDGSYVRLRNIQLGYTIPVKAVQSLQVYLAVQNAFIWTKFSGIDPEVGLDSNNSAIAGVYQDLYPQARTTSLGVRCNF
ncbi:TonB-dependent receptor [Telluribacter sp. SYSU D00476]|uniref:SusC/RagA family TonB-linked outer membrane protein n=1 Tax=Telluribacter sp. SYSU D00476 TaxID=2811430 RepID=UPI001FF4D524|nr:TonB-dependent receptor [Telluribacter sp. SYSU D00476]